jgi:hypothetical protein
MTGLPDADVAPATRRIVELVRRVPVEYRDFNRTAADAVVLHRISGPLLCDLVAAGLPHVGRGENALFDDRDLANVSASLALRSAWFLGQRGWARVLQRRDAGSPGIGKSAGSTSGWEKPVRLPGMPGRRPAC